MDWNMSISSRYRFHILLDRTFVDTMHSISMEGKKVHK